MQRTAAIVTLLTFTALCWPGCAGEDTTRRRPLPQPPVVIQKPRPLPRPWQPLPVPKPPPVVAKPAPKPAEPDTGEIAGLVPRGGIRRNLWKVIVVHHSANDIDSPQSMHAYHLQRGWEHGLGYHFVIGNGVNYPDGKVFAGPRWKQQATGAHCKAGPGKYFGAWRPANFFNEHGIGICLVGNFESRGPTAKQKAALKKLIAALSAQTGISAGRVYGHGEITHKTACPGRHMNLASIRSAVTSTGEFESIEALLSEP